MTCGSDIGSASKYLQKLCRAKGFDYRGCAEIVMPENYIALFTTPEREEALEIIKRAEPAIEKLHGKSQMAGFLLNLFKLLQVKSKAVWSTRSIIRR